jgi:hypothetical protein
MPKQYSVDCITSIRWRVRDCHKQLVIQLLRTTVPRLPLIAAALIGDLVIVAFVARDLRRHFKEPG